MLRELYDKKRDTFDETAEKNRENIIGLENDLNAATKSFQKSIDTLNNDVDDLKMKTTEIDDNAESIRQINLKLKGVQDVEFLQIELTPENLASGSYDCRNEIFTQTAIILVGISADNGEIVDNMKTIADAGVEAQEVKIDGILPFKCKKKPSKNVYFSIIIFNAI